MDLTHKERETYYGILHKNPVTLKLLPGNIKIINSLKKKKL